MVSLTASTVGVTWLEMDVGGGGPPSSLLSVVDAVSDTAPSVLLMGAVVVVCGATGPVPKVVTDVAGSGALTTGTGPTPNVVTGVTELGSVASRTGPTPKVVTRVAGLDSTGTGPTPKVVTGVGAVVVARAAFAGAAAAALAAAGSDIFGPAAGPTGSELDASGCTGSPSTRRSEEADRGGGFAVPGCSVITELPKTLLTLESSSGTCWLGRGSRTDRWCSTTTSVTSASMWAFVRNKGRQGLKLR